MRYQSSLQGAGSGAVGAATFGVSYVASGFACRFYGGVTHETLNVLCGGQFNTANVVQSATVGGVMGGAFGAASNVLGRLALSRRVGTAILGTYNFSEVS